MMPTKKRVADIIVDILIKNNIDVCFSVVGGGAMHLNNAFALAQEKIRIIYNHHEQACAMAAEGYARLTGKLAAVCVTSGPGGTNAINGVQGAWVDSVPMIVIAGHPRYETTVAATGLDIRTRGVQENDIISQIKPITKYAKLILDPYSIYAEMQKAIDIALSGRRGPVWLSIPLNVQATMIESDQLYKLQDHKERFSVSDTQMKELYNILSAAKRPCILTGSGIRTGNVAGLYRQMCEKFAIPIVGGALQADINCNGEKRYYGMSGNIGPRCGNFILQNADVILVLGNSLSTSQTGFNTREFAPNAKIVMVDAQPDEAKKPDLHIHMFIHSDLRTFFEKCIQSDISVQAQQNWIEYCDEVYTRFPRYEALIAQGELCERERIPVLFFWKEFMERVPFDAVIALGNSSCVRGLLQVGIEQPAQRVLVNYNCGSMGDDLPEAIGAVLGNEGKEVYCVTGDGSIMMNLQELQTISYHRFPIKIILFNNQGYGAIRATCRNYFEGFNAGCDYESGVGFPDFAKIAQAFEFPFFRSTCVGDLKSGLDWILEQSGPCILEIYQKFGESDSPKVMSKLDPETNQFITPPLYDMSPFLDREEIEKYLLKD